MAPQALIREERPREVRATFSDGTVMTLERPTVSNDSIVGEAESGTTRVASGDVRSVEVRRLSIVRTVALAAANAGVIAGFMTLVVYIQPHYRGF